MRTKKPKHKQIYVNKADTYKLGFGNHQNAQILIHIHMYIHMFVDSMSQAYIVAGTSRRMSNFSQTSRFFGISRVFRSHFNVQRLTAYIYIHTFFHTYIHMHT